MNKVKLTVTVTKNEFRKIEHEKKKQGLTRSALIQKMIKSFFQKKSENQKKVAACIAGYKKKPEKISEVTARTLTQIQTSEIKVARRTNKFHTALKRVNEKHGKTLKKLR